MKPTLRQRLRYRFDRLMSHGTPAMIGVLFVLSLVVILLAGIFLTATGISQDTNPLPLGEAIWESLMRTLDPGTMGSDNGSGFRAVMLFVTLGGIFIVSALIGVLNNAIQDRMDLLRKGRSVVLENNHTIIFGWSLQIFTILSELMIANENQKNARIVILAEMDKVEMEQAIRDRVTVRGSTRIICRSGDPVDVNDLEIVNPQTAKSIIILPPDDDNDPDTAVIKTVLAITNNPNRRAEPYHIVTQLRNETNLNLIQLAGGRDNVQAVLSSDLIARVVAQTSRQSGLSIVYTELMNFGGDEIYLQHEPSLTGKTYGESLNLFDDSSLIGLKKADGTIQVSPSMDTLIEKDDRIIALSEDDDTIHLSNLKLIPINEQSLRSSQKPVKPETEKCLIVGWNRSGAIIVRELDNYVPKGSLLTIFSDTYAVDKQLKRQGVKLKNQKLTVVEGDTTDRELLNKLDVEEYDHVIVLSNGGLDHKEADAKTLVTLLHLRHMAGQDETPFSIVSEMLDIRNRELAEVTQVDDFIVSDHLISLMLSQLSEDADLFDVFKDIFDPEGVEIYLKPISDYVETGTEVNFYTVVEAARRRGETAIGYRLDAESKDAGKSYGVHTNPLKSTSVTYAPEDKVIVIAEE